MSDKKLYYVNGSLYPYSTYSEPGILPDYMYDSNQTEYGFLNFMETLIGTFAVYTGTNPFDMIAVIYSSDYTIQKMWFSSKRNELYTLVVNELPVEDDCMFALYSDKLTYNMMKCSILFIIERTIYQLEQLSKQHTEIQLLKDGLTAKDIPYCLAVLRGSDSIKLTALFQNARVEDIRTNVGMYSWTDPDVGDMSIIFIDGYGTLLRYKNYTKLVLKGGLIIYNPVVEYYYNGLIKRITTYQEDVGFSQVGTLNYRMYRLTIDEEKEVTSLIAAINIAKRYHGQDDIVNRLFAILWQDYKHKVSWHVEHTRENEFALVAMYEKLSTFIWFKYLTPTIRQSIMINGDITSIETNFTLSAKYTLNKLFLKEQ